MFKTCPRCGANNDPGERCDCLGSDTDIITRKEVTTDVKINDKCRPDIP